MIRNRKNIAKAIESLASSTINPTQRKYAFCILERRLKWAIDDHKKYTDWCWECTGGY